ncbi:hypothetical protein [Rhizobium sp. Nf11,1]|uniref:hypothetical protein n=1 Tax=Rhizobium sp. Nf11,1 TaxID=3404923 RepID=UPI003D33E98E
MTSRPGLLPKQLSLQALARPCPHAIGRMTAITSRKAWPFLRALNAFDGSSREAELQSASRPTSAVRNAVSAVAQIATSIVAPFCVRVIVTEVILENTQPAPGFRRKARSAFTLTMPDYSSPTETGFDFLLFRQKRCSNE